MSCTTAEQWRPVADPLYAAHYSVSNFGNVRSNWINRDLKPGRTSKGYLSVVLQSGTKTKSETVHRLVAQVWLDAPTEGRNQLNHKNGVKDDNRAENLEWCTQSENIRHAIDNHLYPPRRGEDAPNARLTADQVNEIRGRQYKRGDYGRWSLEFGISQTAIRQAHQGKTFASTAQVAAAQ